MYFVGSHLILSLCVITSVESSLFFLVSLFCPKNIF
nr:MAG TPA: hypothetical protein [Caudoviricetes sp.]